MILTMWLSLLDKPTGAFIGGPDALWVRQVETGALPDLTDRVVLWPATDDDDPAGGPMWDVYRRYMGSDGGWHVELARMAVDPAEDARDYIARTRLSETSSRWGIWRTSSDGDPTGKLRTGGWKLYGEEPDRG
jgi:hypothetical protein